MAAADRRFTSLHAATMKTLIGLLAVTGMRIGGARTVIRRCGPGTRHRPHPAREVQSATVWYHDNTGPEA